MSLASSNHGRESARLAAKIGAATLIVLFAAAICNAQEIIVGVTYVCNGEHIYLEGCNILSTSDTSTCMVAHPDHLTSTGLNTYTSMARGALKKLLPTCQQPTAKQIAAAKAFQKKQDDTYNANEKKSHRAAQRRHPARHPRPAAKAQDSGRARHHTLRHLRPASCNLHGEFTPRRVQPDGRPGDALTGQGTAIRPDHGRRLRRPRQVALGFH